MIEALIFDVDGVLVDSMHLHAHAWKTAFAEAGIDFDEREIYGMEGANDKGIVEMVTKSLDKEIDDGIFNSVPARKHELFNVDDVKVFDGMDTCLQNLKNDLLLAVVSGSDRSAVEKMMGRFFPDTFNVMVSGSDGIQGKPNPDPYNKAVEELGVRKENCIVVENAPLGVEAAKSAGLFCIGLPTYVDSTQLEHANLVLKNHEELIAYLKETLE
ncbi:HAD family phosphatase [Methanolobus sp. ZRKC2]|uniref:HAD family hydrolase n=1 Tax=Methanolobus sp. ZRKC2 TaxID=3125783 RepID=UPI00324706D6